MEKVDFILFAVKTSVILGIFYGAYHFLMRNRSNHQVSRWYILGTLILTLVIPFIENPFAEQVVHSEQDTLLWIAKPVLIEGHSGREVVSGDPGIVVWGIIEWIYVVGVMLLAIRSIFHLVVLFRLVKSSKYVKKSDYKLYRTAHHEPFSFMSYIFMPGQLFGSESFDRILMHEYAHVRQRHSYDRLLMDFFVTLFWFNPFIYLYRRALIEVHEYQADKAVISSFPDLVKYQEILYAQLSTASCSGLVSHFNFSITKKRIVMMNKINEKRSMWRYLLVIPLILMVVFAFSFKEVTHHFNWVEGEVSVMMMPEVSLLEVPDPVPSILPIKIDETLSFRLSSGFGIRKDPILKIERPHHGVDFAAPTGTPVLAAADGEVVVAKFNKGGYGRVIDIKHGSYLTRYAQLSEFTVKQGQRVTEGEIIGYVGSSGKSTGPHLHYEVHRNGTPVNPVDYIQDYTFESSKK